jgi:class 3 adenylate cyclase
MSAMGLIAALNSSVPIDVHSVRVVTAARALVFLASARDFDGHRLRIRIGVATGPVAAGTVGGAERQTFTLYGDTVNLGPATRRAERGAPDGLPDLWRDF